MSSFRSLLLAYTVALASAGPVRLRAVTSLNEEAFKEAQQRDDTATRAFSNVQIKTSDGRCLFVDELSGDFRANLTPIQVAACGATDGQGWDIITKGLHDDQNGTMLVVSTLTQACMNFDPRRPAGNQVNLFSCGGRADGGGQVTNSQLFAFAGGAGPLSLQPVNEAGSCFAVKGAVVDVAACSDNDAQQTFTLGDETATSSAPETTGAAATTTTAAEEAGTTSTAAQETGQTTAEGKSTSISGTKTGTSSCSQRTRTVTVSRSAPVSTSASASASASSAGESTADNQAPTAATTTASATETTSSTSAPVTTAAALATANPTTAVPVSRAGGTLDPSAAAEANRRDDTAERAFAGVEIRAPNGQCLAVDPTAGDFRQNLIPVGLVDCGGAGAGAAAAAERWDLITKGRHNDAQGAVLVVSSLTQGCISIDERRPAGDTVTLFSCGGRADGGGDTNAGQLIPFDGALSFPFAPVSENNKTCILPSEDAGRLISGPCPDEVGPQLFSIFPE